MAKSANLYARIEPEVKEQAENILATLGIPVSNAINSFRSSFFSVRVNIIPLGSHQFPASEPQESRLN